MLEGTRLLTAAKLDDASLCARLILEKATRSTYEEFIKDSDRTMSASEVVAFLEMIKQRSARTPMAYILGEKEFYSLALQVDSHVLIPRPETELIVDYVLDLFSPNQKFSMCDVGTGSGAIAIAVKSFRPKCEMTAVDISLEALRVAQKNAKKHSVNIEWIQGDLLSNVKRCFDVITANLPYIPSQEIEGLQPDVKDHEPRLALDGGPDGLELIKKLILDAHQKIGPDGIMLLEFGQGQHHQIEKLCSMHFDSTEVVRDYASIPRMIVARKLGT